MSEQQWDSQWQELVDAAKEASQRAYVPYSGFKVGVAIRTADGAIIKGCNIENASYGLSNCAERTALFKAHSDGIKEFTAMAIIADSPKPVTPCGACRQVILELYSRTAPILLTNFKGDLHWTTLDELLPHAFDEVPGL